MSWWQFWKPRDRVDGYTPPEPAPIDPWATPEIQAAIKSAPIYGLHQDGYVNTLTGIGDWTRDKTLGGMLGGPTFEVRLLSSIDCENRWRSSDLGGRIVETIPDEMTREGFDLQIQPSEEDDKTDAFGDPTAPPPMLPPLEQGPKPLPEIDDSGTVMAEAIAAKLDELGAEDIFWQALSYERAFGGAAIFLGAQDNVDPSQPLNESNISDITHLTAFRGGWDGELVAWSYYGDITQPNYGMPNMYMLRNLGVPIVQVPAPGQAPAAPITNPANNVIRWVHESRLLIFPGVSVSPRARVQMRGWGDSVFTRVDQVLAQYEQTWGGVANLMTDFSQGVMAIKNLAQVMAANNKAGSQLLLSRSRDAQMTRSIARMLVIDADETFSRDTASLAGISDVLQQFALRLAAAADMPVDLLMGQTTAGGLNKGDTTLRFFYDRIAARQKKRMLPQLRKMIRLLMTAKRGPTKGVEPEKWTVNFKPLYQETAAERAARVLQVAQADQIYLANQVVTPEEVAATRFGGSEFSDGPIVLDLDGREEMAAQFEADQKKREQQLKKQQQPPADKPPQEGDKPTNGSNGHTVKVEISPK